LGNRGHQASLESDSMKKLSIILLLLFLAALIVLSPFLDNYMVYLLNIVCIAVLISTGLNLVTGYAGQVNLGQSGFVAIGAYATTILMTKLGIWFWGALPLGALIAALAGSCIAIPSLRIKGVYLALVTFGFASIVEMILIHWVSLTRGPDGLQVPSPRLGSFSFNSDLKMFYLIFAITIIMVVLAKNIIGSRVGRAFISIRDSEIAAKSVGVDVTAYKIIAFVLSAFYGGIAGGLYAALVMFISPDAFGVLESVIYITMIVVGGMGSILGAIIGGAVLSLLPELLRGLKEVQEFVFGAVLVISLIFLPNGLVGLAEKFARRKNL
jgi:branched-chain amino acid transport system permease protein